MSIPEMITIGFSVITIIFSVLIILDSYKVEKIVNKMMKEELIARHKSRVNGETHWHDSIKGYEDNQFTIKVDE
jgi:hypothetical protein